MNWSAVKARLRAGGWLAALGLFLAVIAILFRGAFEPGQTLFSNDGPLGQLMAQCHSLPGRFAGCWLDLNNVGFNGGAAAPSLSFGLQWLLGPLWFSKLYAMMSLLILGLGAWCFFRQMKLAPLACVLGGLAAVLNSTFFSVACWGMGAHDITAGMAFFALAALADTTSPQRWLRVVLAGLALGMAVTEGADVGALFSLYVAAFVLYQVWTVAGPRATRLAAGAGRLLLVAVCAAFLAAQSIHGLVGTSITGIKGTQQDAQTKKQRWDWATQWSLPKLEALNLVVPGLFGYRGDTMDEQVYWGRMGRDPAWETYIANGRVGPKPTGFLRYSGGGNYASGFVLLVGLWAAAQALRRKPPIFAPAQRKWLWFWTAVAGVSLVLAFGRFAPLYQWVYALPYLSTIRNPTKFLYFFSVAVAVLFAYGVDGLWRQYLRPGGADAGNRRPGPGGWWRRADRFEKNWVYGCALAGLLILAGWWIYATNREALTEYLQGAQIGASPGQVADFSIRQVGWFVLVYFLAAGLMVVIFSGALAGRKATAGGLCLGLLLVADLGLANQPWIRYWNYEEKYSSNAVVDVLRDKPYEHRAALAPLEVPPKLATLSQLYRLEWLQQLFPYYNIQSFETVEMPRIPLDYAGFTREATDTNGAGAWFRLTRAWQLSTTRYILAPVAFVDFWNETVFPAQPPLDLITRFAIVRKPGIMTAKRPDQVTAMLATNGPFALFDFTAALPRAKLYSRWQISTNDNAALDAMFTPQFDPGQNLFVAGDVPASAGLGTNSSPGAVDIVSYAPKDIALQANATAPAVLLLNDHYDPAWKVFVDGQAAGLLRCNYLMRGVYLPAGAHRVEFRFAPPLGWLYLSLAAVATALTALVIFVIWTAKTRVVVPVAAAPTAAAAKQPQTNAAARKRGKSPGNRVVKR
jgi:hypothetical protein